MKKICILIIISALMIVLGALAVSAHTCAVSIGIDKPLLPDTDCDRFVDLEDNCPFIVNPTQSDADYNGLGDACDLYIESIRTNPSDFVFNGRAFNTLATIYNNREYNIRNLKVRVFMPELGIESVQYIDNIEVCSAETIEFFLRAPACVPMNDYKIFVEASFINVLGETEIIPGITSIRVMPDEYCQMVLANSQVIGNTFIDVMQIQDVYKGSEAVFPIKISNNEKNDKEYIVSITGLDSWGSFRLDPSSLIIVSSQSQETMDLYISANQDIPPGERVFVVSIQSGEETQRFLLIANVKETGFVDRAFLLFFSLKILLIAGLIALIALAIIVGMRKYINSIRNENVQYY
jgi:hypothetical protein